MTHFKLPDELIGRIDSEAARRVLSRAQLVRLMLEYALTDYEAQDLDHELSPTRLREKEQR